jgi:3-dehydroquinate dehydratase/shikimate dehydrogenase
MALFGRDRICAVVAATTAREMQRLAARALRLTRTVELRMDWLQHRRDWLQMLAWLRRNRSRGCFIGTLRTVAEGGKYRPQKSSLAHSRKLLEEMSAAGFHWLDLGTGLLPLSRPLAELLPGPSRRPSVPLIRSHHDFQRTPPRLTALARSLASSGASATKIATHCHSYRDALRVLSLCRGRDNLIAVPMGEVGLPLRVLALRAGSALAYAAAGEKTAPGQLTLEEMKLLYRADRLNRRTRLYGVIGDPIGHSLSPLMHNRAFQLRRINAVYLPFRVTDLREFLRAVPELGLSGFSVTLPHKERILDFLDDCEPLAAEIGAVNTVVVSRSGKLSGCNTDYVGVLRALESRVRPAGSRVLVLGAGGAARAVAFALARAGAIVTICSRRAQPAQRLARAVGGEVLPRAALRREFFDAIVNCTPVGMYPRLSESPLRPGEINARLVFDTVYRPRQTRLLALAAARGVATVSGIEMFVAQGAAQFEIWTARRAPEAEMRRAVLEALRREERARH